MKGSDLQYLVNALVKTSRSGFKSVLQEMMDSTVPIGRVTKVEEGFIEINGGVRKINIDRIQEIIKQKPMKVKAKEGGEITIPVYMICIA